MLRGGGVVLWGGHTSIVRKGGWGHSFYGQMILAVSLLFLPFCGGQVVDLATTDLVLEVCSRSQEVLNDVPVTGSILTKNRLTGDVAYATDQDCERTLRYPVGGSVLFTFKYFDMEWTNIISDQGIGDEHCKYDYFSINGYKYCGYIPEKTVCIYNGEDGDEVPLHFYSDDYMGPNGPYTERFRGLEINFETYIDNQCTCTANVTGSQEPCIFPFKHQGKTYFTCSVDSPSDSFSAVSTPYCATAVDENSEMTAAGTCTDTTACFPKCYAVSGRECSFPVLDDAGFEYSSCRYFEEDEKMMCPVLQARSYGAQKTDVEQVKKQECEATSGCSFVLMCNQFAVPLKNGLYFSHVDYNNNNPYPEDYTCSSSATTQESMSYYVTIHNLQIRCELQDYFRVSSQSASSTDFRLCGNYENMPSSTISFCVMKPLSSDGDLYLNLELVSGPGEKGGYSGLYVEFFTTNDEVLCPLLEDSTQNEACDNPNGLDISSPTDILSYNFPHIYPTGLSCRWTISPDSNNPTLFPVLQMVQMDLGVTSEILENDTILIGDGQQNDVNWTMLTSADESSIPFVFTDRTGTVDFTSGYYYNLHTNFKLSISYLDVSNNSQIFENAGLCLSVDKTAICHFPFSEEGQEYNSCWRLGGDTEASCKTVEGTKIFCDMNNFKCVPPFTTFDSNTQVISPVDATPGSFNVSWQLSNANWDTVTILLNGQEMGSTSGNNFTLTDLATDTLYVVQLFINSFGRRDPNFYSMEFLTSSGDAQGIYLLVKETDRLDFKWDPITGADSYTIKAVPWAFNEVAARLVDTDSLDTPFNTTENNTVELNGLYAGLAYNVTIVAHPVEVEIFAIGFTEPNGLSVESNELSVSVENGNFILNGIMLNDTTCQSIEVKVQRAIQYVHESDQRRSRRNADPFADFDNEEVSVAVFDLSNEIINSENNQFQNMDLGVAEPGTWYLFVVRGFNVLPGVGVELEMNTDPDPVTNLRLIERGTDSLTFTWDPPSQGQYNFFRVQFTQGDSLLTDETSDSVLNRTGLTPGVVYKVSVTTISYQESASQTVELTEETVPLPVLTFGALGDHSTEDEDPRVISFNFQPPNPDRIGWSGFRLYTWELYYNGTRNFDLTNVTLTPEFPANVSSGTDDFPVTYMKYGTLYEADVVTLSENGDLESEPTSYKIITEPKSLESFTIAYLDDQILRANWSLDRHDNNFNRFLVQVYNNDTDELLVSEAFQIGGQASSGTFELDISSLDSISEFRVQVITEVEYPDVLPPADSDPAQFFITPDLPEIVDDNATLTKITAYIDVSAFGDESTFLANLKKASTGESLVNISVNAADCTDDLTRCPVTFFDLDPGTDYTATVYVVSTPSPYKMSFTGDLFSTASLPDDFISTSHNASSYMMRVNFENLPFGDTDEIVQYTIIMAEKSGGSNFKADNAVNTMYWSNYIDTEDPYQVLPLENYPMTFNIEQTDQSWFVDIGVDICDPDVSIRQVCNGPLMSMTEYSLWVAGVTATGHAILSVKIGGLTTIADGISEPAIVNKSLTALTAVFDPVLPEEATYTVQAINTLTGDISFSNIQGSSCSPNCSVELTGLQPATDYDVIITPFYSGVERRSETVVVSSSLLPDAVVVAPEFNIENPSSSFKVTVSGLPFGEDEFVSSYLVIVASEDHPTDELNSTLPTTTYAEAGIDPDNQTTSIPPYLPWGNQTYPPENTVDDTFSLVIGSEDCNGTETGFCNGPLPRNSNFKIWLATYPEGNADAIVRGPYTGFSTFPATVSELTVISSTLTSVTFAFPVLENEVTSATTYPAGDANNPITTYTNLTGDNPLCPQAAFLNYCLLTFEGLDPRTNYTVECVFNKTDSDETQRRDFTTGVLPSITVTHSTEDLDDPYTTLKILVDGLPFGLDTSITQYKILVSAVNETDTMENPETWAIVSVNDSWTAYTPFETKSYSTLKSDSYEGQWEFLLGEEFPCPSSGACNGPLHPGTEYAIRIVGVTQTGHEITTDVFQTFSTLPIEVEFVAEATLVQIVSNFSLLDSTKIKYRIEISSLPLEDSGRHDTQPLTLDSCGGSSSQWCVWMSKETLPSPPDFQVCLFVEYTNYNKAPYQCQIVSIPTPSEKYSEFKVTTSQDIVNPYTEVLLQITGLPFGVDSSITSYYTVVALDEDGSRRQRRYTDEQMDQTNETWSTASKNDFEPYVISTPLPYPPSEFVESNSTSGGQFAEVNWTITLGEEYPCAENETYCNGPLDPGSNYKIKFVGMTDSGWSVSTDIFKEFATKSSQLSAEFDSGLVVVEATFNDSFPPEETTFHIQVRNEDTGEESSYNLTGTEVCEEVSSETTDSSQIDFNCVITVATLEMGVNYAVNITPSVNGVEMGLFQHSFITGVLPNITVELWEESNRVTDITTQLEANITGLPFGRDPFVTQYAVIVANNHTFNQTPPVYPDDVEPYASRDMDQHAHQLAQMDSYPPTTEEGTDQWFLLIGQTDPNSCSRICNGPLRPDTGYTIWFVGEIDMGVVNGEAEKRYIMSEGFSGLYTQPGEPAIEPQATDFQAASLTPIFIIVAVVVVLLLFLVLLCCLRKAGQAKARVYPFLRYFSPVPRKTLYAYEHYSQDDSSVNGSNAGGANIPHPLTTSTPPPPISAADKALSILAARQPDFVDNPTHTYPPSLRPMHLDMSNPSSHLIALAPPTFNTNPNSDPRTPMTNPGMTRFPPKPQQPPPHLKLPYGFRNAMLLPVSPMTSPADQVDKSGQGGPGQDSNRQPEAEQEEEVLVRRPRKKKAEEMNTPTAFIDLAEKFS